MDSDAQQVVLQPPLARVAGQATVLQASFTPFGNQVVVVNAPQSLAATSTNSQIKHKQLLYTAKHTHQSLESRSFYVDSYTVYASLQARMLQSHSRY